MSGFERLLRDLASDDLKFAEFQADPYGVGTNPPYRLTAAEVDTILSGDKVDIDNKLEAEGSNARYQPRGQVVV